MPCDRRAAVAAPQPRHRTGQPRGAEGCTAGCVTRFYSGELTFILGYVLQHPTYRGGYRVRALGVFHSHSISPVSCVPRCEAS